MIMDYPTTQYMETGMRDDTVPPPASPYVNEVVAHVLNGAKRATKYVSPTFTIKATRPHKPDKRAGGSTTISLTVGRPNYAEREFIKQAKKAGEPFPIKRVLLKAWPTRKQK